MAPDAVTSTSHWFDGSITSILVIGALIGFFRGVVSQVLWVLALVAGGAAVYWSHRQLGSLGLLTGRSLMITSGTAGLVAYWVVRKFTGWLVFLKSLEMTGGSGMLAGLVPSGALVWLAGVGMRWLGAQDHLSELSDAMKNPQHRALAASVWSDAKRALDSGMLGRVVGWFDPVTPEAHVNLAKLIVVANGRNAAAYQNDEAIAHALQNPKVQSLRKKERIRLLVEHKDYAALFYDRDVNAALADPEFKKELESLRFPAQQSEMPRS